MRLIAIFMIFLPVYGANTIKRPVKFKFSLNSGVRHVLIHDLDGDGKKEMIFLGKGKNIAIYTFKDSFEAGVDTSFEGALIDFGDIYPAEKGDEIVVLENGSVSIFKYSGGRINLLRKFNLKPSIIYPESSKVLRLGRAIYRVNGRNLILFLYPFKGILIDTNGVRKEFDIFTREEISTFSDRSSPSEQSDIYSVKSSYTLPVMFFKDIDGDSSDEFLQFIRDTLFKGTNSLLDLSFLSSGDKIKIFPPRIYVRDINNDGLVDVLVGKGEIGAPLGKRSSVYLFLNKNGKFGRLPDQVIISESFSPEVVLKDINGDGKLDLILTTSGFNLLSLIKLILTRKIDLKYSIFLFNEHSFTKTPIYTRSFSIKFGGDSTFTGVDFSMDFDGDGMGDIVYFKKDKIEIYPGNGRTYAKKPSQVFEVKTSSNYMVDDIDGNGKLDFLFWNSKDGATDVWGLLR